MAPSMPLFTKKLTFTDIVVRLEMPTKALKEIDFQDERRSVDLVVTDRKNIAWEFRCSKRPGVKHPRPAISGQWLKFVQSKGLQIDDEVIFHKLDGGQYNVEVVRETTIKLFGKEIKQRAPVD